MGLRDTTPRRRGPPGTSSLGRRSPGGKGRRISDGRSTFSASRNGTCGHPRTHADDRHAEPRRRAFAASGRRQHTRLVARRVLLDHRPSRSSVGFGLPWPKAVAVDCASLPAIAAAMPVWSGATSMPTPRFRAAQPSVAKAPPAFRAGGANDERQAEGVVEQSRVGPMLVSSPPMTMRAILRPASRGGARTGWWVRLSGDCSNPEAASALDIDATSPRSSAA
jgi:hypothetical protein